MSGFQKYFNGTTIAGRANVAKATYASIALFYIIYRLKRRNAAKLEPVNADSNQFGDLSKNECWAKVAAERAAAERAAEAAEKCRRSELPVTTPSPSKCPLTGATTPEQPSCGGDSGCGCGASSGSGGCGCGCGASGGGCGCGGANNSCSASGGSSNSCGDSSSTASGITTKCTNYVGQKTVQYQATVNVPDVAATSNLPGINAHKKAGCAIAMSSIPTSLLVNGDANASSVRVELVKYNRKDAKDRTDSVRSTSNLNPVDNLNPEVMAEIGLMATTSDQEEKIETVDIANTVSNDHLNAEVITGVALMGPIDDNKFTKSDEEVEVSEVADIANSIGNSSVNAEVIAGVGLMQTVEDGDSDGPKIPEVTEIAKFVEPEEIEAPEIKEITNSPTPDTEIDKEVIAGVGLLKPSKVKTINVQTAANAKPNTNECNEVIAGMSVEQSPTEEENIEETANTVPQMKTPNATAAAKANTNKPVAGEPKQLENAAINKNAKRKPGGMHRKRDSSVDRAKQTKTGSTLRGSQGHFVKENIQMQKKPGRVTIKTKNLAATKNHIVNATSTTDKGSCSCGADTTAQNQCASDSLKSKADSSGTADGSAKHDADGKRDCSAYKAYSYIAGNPSISNNGADGDSSNEKEKRPCRAAMRSEAAAGTKSAADTAGSCCCPQSVATNNESNKENKAVRRDADGKLDCSSYKETLENAAAAKSGNSNGNVPDVAEDVERTPCRVAMRDEAATVNKTTDGTAGSCSYPQSMVNNESNEKKSGIRRDPDGKLDCSTYRETLKNAARSGNTDGNAFDASEEAEKRPCKAAIRAAAVSAKKAADDVTEAVGKGAADSSYSAQAITNKESVKPKMGVRRDADGKLDCSDYKESLQQTIGTKNALLNSDDPDSTKEPEKRPCRAAMRAKAKAEKKAAAEAAESQNITPAADATGSCCCCCPQPGTNTASVESKMQGRRDPHGKLDSTETSANDAAARETQNRPCRAAMRTAAAAAKKGYIFDSDSVTNPSPTIKNVSAQGATDRNSNAANNIGRRLTRSAAMRAAAASQPDVKNMIKNAEATSQKNVGQNQQSTKVYNLKKNTTSNAAATDEMDESPLIRRHAILQRIRRESKREAGTDAKLNKKDDSSRSKGNIADDEPMKDRRNARNLFEGATAAATLVAAAASSSANDSNASKLRAVRERHPHCKRRTCN